MVIIRAVKGTSKSLTVPGPFFLLKVSCALKAFLARGSVNIAKSQLTALDSNNTAQVSQDHTSQSSVGAFSTPFLVLFLAVSTLGTTAVLCPGPCPATSITLVSAVTLPPLGVALAPLYVALALLCVTLAPLCVTPPLPLAVTLLAVLSLIFFLLLGTILSVEPGPLRPRTSLLPES